jgi:hypothetical protein
MLSRANAYLYANAIVSVIVQSEFQLGKVLLKLMHCGCVVVGLGPGIIEEERYLLSLEVLEVETRV